MMWEPTGRTKTEVIAGTEVTLLEFRSPYGVLAWATEQPVEVDPPKKQRFVVR